MAHTAKISILAALSVLLCPVLLAKNAEIANVTAGGVGNVDFTRGSNGVSATIGRWDTPYPNASTGEPAPGLEPDGASTLAIDVDVNDGGTVSFDFQFLTYDAGIYDWLDVYMVTPTATVPLVSQYGKPGEDYGSYWVGAHISLNQVLDAWRNQRVTFYFSVQQDGWGDQSATRLFNFAVRSCPVPPLTELTDPDALAFENGNTVDTAHLNPAMQAALACLRQQVTGAGGTLTVTSGYRPPAYQAHLREVWDRWNSLRNLRDPDCEGLRSEVQQEFQKHGLQLSQRPASESGAHTRGEAFDAHWSANITAIDALASHCALKRPLIPTDPVHFIHQ